MMNCLLRSKHWFGIGWYCLLIAIGFGVPRSLALGEMDETITIYRDPFGVPHLFAETEEGVCFAHGYAQAEDRLEEVLKQYLRCTGRMSAAFGSSFLEDDYRQRLWNHEGVAREKYNTLDAKSRSLIEAYQAGIQHYMATHPSQVPAWAPVIEPWMVPALSRYILWGWPEGEAADDLGRVGIAADPVEYRGSNQWLVAPSRTAEGKVLALIDPHLSWYGAFRFYEVRMYGGELAFSGVSLLGMPLPLLGHNAYCSIAMTTGGPDTSDVYEEELHPDDPRQYRVDGQWRKMDLREERIDVLEGDKKITKTVVIESTRHGPVVARRDGKAFVFAIPYADQVGMADQTWKMISARNLDEMKSALGMLQLMMQNIMIGTVDGDIFYVRNGRVPIRPTGYDWKRPMPGNVTRNDWLGIHPFADLLQMHNPSQGYMQNCNNSPQFMMKKCTLAPNPAHPYLFNGFIDESRMHDKPLHQRAASCLEQLDRNTKMTVEDAIELALSPWVYGAASWQAKLEQAWQRAPAEVTEKPMLQSMYRLIQGWNQRCDADSTGAIPYQYWKMQFGESIKLADKAGKLASEQLTDREILENLEKGAVLLMEKFGKLDVAYGEVYRVGRKGADRTWPVSGGNNDHIATPRAIGFDSIPGTKQFLGKSGQTSTQVVQLSRPPKSWSLLPLGESDDPSSGHFDDQAEKLFGPGKMKTSYFLDKAGLVEASISKTVLVRRTTNR